MPDHIDDFERLQPISYYATLIYDNIITIALALNTSIADLQSLKTPRRLEDFSYSDEEMAKVILSNADNIDFVGLSVRKYFSYMYRCSCSIIAATSRVKIMQAMQQRENSNCKFDSPPRLRLSDNYSVIAELLATSKFTKYRQTS